MGGTEVVLGGGLVVKDGQDGALIVRGRPSGGVYSPEGLADGALLALEVLGAAPHALEGLHDAPLASAVLEDLYLTIYGVLDWPCWQGRGRGGPSGWQLLGGREVP